MNRNVIKTMLILCISELIVWYILKLFIPQYFVLQINSPVLLKIGAYIDSHTDLRACLNIITAFITYWLYLCAILKQKKLSLTWCLIVILVILISFFIEALYPEYVGYYSLLMMLILPAILGADLKTTALVFTIHFIAQFLSLQIRGLAQQVLSFNTVSFLILTLECYFWLLLFYLYYNYKEGKYEN